MTSLATGARIGVLIVDDSAVVRQVLASRLRGAGIEVLGAVCDPIFAMAHMTKIWPDVVVLDLEMPRMDGLTFLRKIMSVRPTPVVVCSALTGNGGDAALEAMAAGAVAVIARPTSGLKDFVESQSGDIVSAVRAAAAGGRRIPKPTVAPDLSGLTGARPAAAMDRVIAIGTSTGGTRALEVVLPALPGDTPGVVIVQHMPERFTAQFADRLDRMCRVRVREAADNDEVATGTVLIAPGGRHMELVRFGSGYRVRIFDGPPVNRHRPSVDVLFSSVARAAGAGALGVIMTGMGDDGARGLLEMRRAGAFTVAQDEATSVVFGMPGEAVQLGAVEREAPLGSIAEVIHRYG